MGSERQVLKIVQELKEANAEAIARKMVVSVDYVAELCKGLVQDGYLSGTGEGKYMITEEGKKSLGPYKGGVAARTVI